MKNGNRILLKTYRYCIDVSFMSSECLSADATPDIPELYKRKTMVSNNRRYLDILQVQTTTATQCIQYSYLSWWITSTWHERVLIWTKRDTHNVSCVSSESHRLLTWFNVPQSTEVGTKYFLNHNNAFVTNCLPLPLFLSLRLPSLPLFFSLLLLSFTIITQCIYTSHMHTKSCHQMK